MTPYHILDTLVIDKSAASVVPGDVKIARTGATLTTIRRSKCVSNCAERGTQRIYWKHIGGNSDGVTYASSECLPIELFAPPANLVNWLKKWYGTGAQ